MADNTLHRKTNVLDRVVADRISEIFAALGDPTRVRILSSLLNQELGVSEIANLAEISESNASHQLRLLRTLRIVRARKVGKQVFYTLDDNHIRDLLERAIQHTLHE